MEDNTVLNNLLKDDPQIIKLIGPITDPIIKVPNRLLIITDTINKYITSENTDHHIMIQQLSEKYKQELKNYKYLDIISDHLIEKKILVIPKKTLKLSNIYYVKQILRNDAGNIIGINAKANKSKVSRKILLLKNYIFEYIGEKNDIRDLLENLIIT